MNTYKFLDIESQAVLSPESGHRSGLSVHCAVIIDQGWDLLLFGVFATNQDLSDIVDQVHVTSKVHVHS